MRPKNVITQILQSLYNFISTLDSGAEQITGRMECTENGPQFVAGKVMEIHGIRTFIPGKMIRDESSGEMVFVPGKMIDGKNGPRFWPGQVSARCPNSKWTF